MTILKYRTLWLLVTFFYSNTYGQPQVTVFAYEQLVLPGTVLAGVTDEQGKPFNTSKAGVSTNFYIYLAHSASSLVQPSSLWIRGKAFQFKLEAVSPPVIQRLPGNSGASGTLTMVPRTTMRVSQLVVAGELPKQSPFSSSLKKKLAASEVVVGYKWQGKIYYTVLKDIKVMEPLMHQ